MTVSQEIEPRRVKIFLPYDLRKNVISQDGTTHFSFDPPVSAAFHTMFLIEYLGAIARLHKTLILDPKEGKSPHQLLETSGLELAIHEMLRETLPDFFGDEHFYRRGSLDFCRKDFEFDTSLPKISFHHPVDERNSDAFVYVWLQSPENLKPTLKNESLGNPTIPSGYMRGYVKIHPRISQPGNDPYATFGPKDVLPILKALLNGENIDLLEPLPRVLPKVVSLEYAHIEHPTIERMKAAIGYATQLSEFFKDQQARLQGVATSVKSARNKYVRQMYELRAAYNTLLKQHELAESLVRQKFPKPTGIDHTLGAVEAAMEKSFEPTNAELRAMSRDFPTEFGKYLPQPRPQLELFARSSIM